jgi:hypothetical protein
VECFVLAAFSGGVWRGKLSPVCAWEVGGGGGVRDHRERERTVDIAGQQVSPFFLICCSEEFRRERKVKKREKER